MNLFQWLPFGKVPELSPQALTQRKDEFQIVDVRTTTEFHANHIEGAINLPITQFSRQAVDHLNLTRNKPVITICLSAHRSVPATRQMLEMGFNAYQLSGGMKAWWRQEP